MIKKKKLLTLVPLFFAFVSHAVNAQPALPLQVGPNGHYFMDQNNQPFFWHGDTCWDAIKLFDHQDVVDYLNDRSSKGFTVIQMNAAGGTDWINRFGERPFNGTDIASPNDAYFTFVDYVLNEAMTRHIVIALNPISTGCCGGTYADYMTLDNMRTYGRWLGQRYQNHHNIIWDLGGDSDAKVQEHRSLQESIEEYTVKLTTFHCGYGHNGADIFPTSTVNFVYTYDPDYCPGGWCPPHVYEKARDAYNRTQAIPAHLGEAFYEVDFPIEKVRRQPYWSILAGTSGHTYGGPLFIPPPDWRDELNTQGTIQMGYVKQLFTTRTWWSLVPDQNNNVMIGGHGSWGSDDYVTAASNPEGTLAIAYIPPTGSHARTLTFDMSRFSGTIAVSWMDPTNGLYDAVGTYNNSGTQEFTSPGSNNSGRNDWVLVLEAEPLSPPSNLNAIAVSASQIDLSWQDNTSGAQQEDGFIVERRLSDQLDQWRQVAVLPADTTHYSDTSNLSGLVSYAYRIGAYTN